MMLIVKERKKSQDKLSKAKRNHKLKRTRRTRSSNPPINNNNNNNNSSSSINRRMNALKNKQRSHLLQTPQQTDLQPKLQRDLRGNGMRNTTNLSTTSLTVIVNAIGTAIGTDTIVEINIMVVVEGMVCAVIDLTGEVLIVIGIEIEMPATGMTVDLNEKGLIGTIVTHIPLLAVVVEGISIDSTEGEILITTDLTEMTVVIIVMVVVMVAVMVATIVMVVIE